jgi:Fe-S-cluster containining protein
VNAPVSDALQLAFNREREEARARKSVDGATARTQTMHMYGRLAALQSDIVAHAKVELACKRGCSYCCHLRVEIRPHDAFVMAQYVRVKFNTEQRARVLARTEDVLARIAALTPDEHIRAGLPCALLEDGVCSVYEARPATCRKYSSVSVDTCRNAFNYAAAPLTGEIEHEQVRMAGNAVALGYAKGLEDAGYDAALYELHYALHSALTNPKAEARYRKGKRPFV